MKKYITPQQSVLALRIGISIIMMAHGFQRVYYGTIDDFGNYLNHEGFIVGVPLAWTITLFELIAGATLAAGYFVKWICMAWMIVIIMGIILVHAANGWYVVGPSTGGVEYSFLILLSLLVLASHDKR
jgi:putative oxidoreductase